MERNVEPNVATTDFDDLRVKLREIEKLLEMEHLQAIEQTAELPLADEDRFRKFRPRTPPFSETLKIFVIVLILAIIIARVYF